MQLVKSFTIVLSLFCFLTSASNSFKTRDIKQSSGVLDSTQVWINGLQRSTFAGQSVNNTLFLTSSGDYFNSLGAIAVFPFALGFISVIVAIVFAIVRFCCNRCGGKDKKQSGYSNPERIAPKVLVLVFAVLILFMIIASIIGNVIYAPFFTSFGDKVKADAQIQQNRTANVYPTLLSINFNRTVIRLFVSALSERAPNAVNSANDSFDFLAGLERGRTVIYSFTLIVAGVTIILGVVAALFNLGKLSMVAAFFSFGAIFMCAFNIAANFPLSVLISDLCFDVKTYTVDRRLQDRLAVGGTIGGIGDIYDCNSFFNANATLFYVDDLLSVNAATLNATNANDTATIQSLQQERDQLLAVRNDVVIIRECSWMKDSLNSLDGDGCGRNFEGTVAIWASSFIMIFFFVAFTILTIVGYKRFSPPNEDTGFF